MLQGLKKGDKVKYTQTDPWGEKSWEVSSKVIAVFPRKVLLENGQEFYHIQ
jgi:hypothetical protein